MKPIAPLLEKSMSEMQIKGHVTISRPNGNGPEVMTIEVADSEARIPFVKVSMPLSDFTRCLTGLAHSPCELTVRGLQNVGKIREQKTIEFPIGKDRHFRDKERAAEVGKSYTPEGWTMSNYFASQNSFFTVDGECWARTQIQRWVERAGSPTS